MLAYTIIIIIVIITGAHQQAPEHAPRFEMVSLAS